MALLLYAGRTINPGHWSAAQPPTVRHLRLAGDCPWCYEDDQRRGPRDIK
jgi:hypothetical protein